MLIWCINSFGVTELVSYDNHQRSVRPVRIQYLRGFLNAFSEQY